jgi:hypothetical protein
MFLFVLSMAGARMSIVEASISFNSNDDIFGGIINYQSNNRAFAQQIKTTTSILFANQC